MHDLTSRNTDAYVNLTQAAALLGVTLPTLRRRIAREQLPLFVGKDGRERLIRRAELTRWEGIRPISKPTSN